MAAEKPGHYRCKLTMAREDDISFFNIGDEERERIETSLTSGESFLIELNKSGQSGYCRYIVNPDFVAYAKFTIQDPEPEPVFEDGMGYY